MNKSTQILVIGGGPAGSTAATLLAREGYDVTLLEREVFPRYHIGESLLPSCLEVFDLLGVRETIESHGFKRKRGGYFEWGNEQWELDFRQLRHPYAFQVVRSEFDQLLLEHAKSQGVKVFEGVEVRSLTFDGERPRSATWAKVAKDGANGEGNETGEISFDFLVDASGRAGIMAMRYLQNRQFHSAFQNIGVWGYWKGARRLPQIPDGSIAVGSVPYGWLWGIPLHDGTLSVGLVTHKTTFKDKRQQYGSVEQFYLSAIQECPLITSLLEPAEMLPGIRAEQDYSYGSDSFAGPGYFMSGDAACFIDPLLSTGVHLATYSGMLTAASLLSVLRGEVSEEQARSFYDQSYRHAYLRLIVIVSAMYQLYDGKDTYFWQAQQLTHHDYENVDLQAAFLYVVSGMEDLRDTEETPEELVATMASEDQDGKAALQARHAEALKKAEEQQKARVKSRLYNSVFMRFSTSPDSAIDGLYVTTNPRLGLAKAQIEQAETA